MEVSFDHNKYIKGRDKNFREIRSDFSEHTY